MGRLHLPSALSAMSNRLRSVPSVVGLKLAFPRIVTMHDPFPSAMSTRRRCRSGAYKSMQVRQFAEKYFGSWRDARAAAPAVPAAADQPTAAPPSTERQARPACRCTLPAVQLSLHGDRFHTPAQLPTEDWAPTHDFRVLATGSSSSLASQVQPCCTHSTGQALVARTRCPWT